MRVCTNEVAREHTQQQFSATGQHSIDLTAGKWRVKEESDLHRRPGLTQQQRQQHQMIIVHPHDIAFLILIQNDFGEFTIRMLIRFEALRDRVEMLAAHQCADMTSFNALLRSSDLSSIGATKSSSSLSAAQLLQEHGEIESRHSELVAKVEAQRRKLTVLMGGYERIATQARDSHSVAIKTLSEQRSNLACFQMLAAYERQGIKTRTQQSTQQLQHVKAIKAQLQRRLAALQRADEPDAVSGVELEIDEPA